MRSRGALAALLATFIVGCASNSGSSGTNSPAKAVASPHAAIAQGDSASINPSPAPDVEMTVCAKFDSVVYPGIAATLQEAIGTGMANPPYSHAEAKLLKDDSRLNHWSYLVYNETTDVTFANYLSDAGVELGVVAAPDSTTAEGVKAAQDIGHVNGYCKYDAS